MFVRLTGSFIWLDAARVVPGASPSVAVFRLGRLGVVCGVERSRREGGTVELLHSLRSNRSISPALGAQLVVEVRERSDKTEGRVEGGGHRFLLVQRTGEGGGKLE